MHKLHHIFRHSLSEGQGRPGNRMMQVQLPAVEGRPGDQAVILGAVEKVSREGVPQMGEMYPDLMGASRLQGKGSQRAAAVRLQNGVAGHGTLSVL